ncbi:MAG: stage III sporulation protein AE [Lachnospiraceae bacterium]
MKKQSAMLFFLLLIGMLFLMQLSVYASEISKEKEISQEELEEKLMNQMDFQRIDQTLKGIFPEEKLKFGETVQAILKGDMACSFQLIQQLVSDQLSYEFRYNKSNMVHILLIAIVAAVFTNFSRVFHNQQVSEISFYILYLLMITLCLDSFRVLIVSVTERITYLSDFMRALGPAYFLAVAIAAGSTTSIVFYNMVLFLIYLIEILILNFLLPFIHVYLMVKVLNHLTQEEYLSKLAELIHIICTWTLKTLLACVVGLNVIQGLISPVIDSIKRSAITRGAEAIPGVGDAIGGVTEVVLGTTVLVKNGIGVTGAIICVGICVIPLIQIGMMTLMYKLIAAVVQPISDNRIVGCISSIGEGCQLLMRVIFTVGVLFLITIAVVTATTT